MNVSNGADHLKKLRPFGLGDKPLFERYLKKQPHHLCSYAFENTWIWRPLFDLKWALINKKFCLFFQDKIGCFMPLSPLGGPDLRTTKTCFEIMEEFNHNPEISRIENIDEADLGFYKRQGLRTYEKAKEYIVSQKDMSLLSGTKFKHKRNLVNFFVRHHNAEFRRYDVKDKKPVLDLYEEWMQGRLTKSRDEIYTAMLKDSQRVFSAMLTDLKHLKMAANVVSVDGKIRAFSSGFPVAKSLFCINFEIADLSLKGIAAYIFCEFAKALKIYPEINIMDDSGLENIRQAKLLYHPARTIVSYTALLAA